MKTILIWLMERELEKCKKDLQQETHAVVRKAKLHRLGSYTTTLLFLKS
jgi:hypothetical protein